MPNGVSSYLSRKTKLEETGHRILHIADVANSKPVFSFLSEALEKLPKNEYYLAFLGLFKRGKSTLINALLGASVLPTGVVPVTSVITRIRYSERPKVQITFGDSSVKQVPAEDLTKYVTEAGNPCNQKKRCNCRRLPAR